MILSYEVQKEISQMKKSVRIMCFILAAMFVGTGLISILLSLF